MAIKLTGGQIYDPTHQVDGETRDLYIIDDKISHDLPAHEKVTQTYDLSN